MRASGYAIAEREYYTEPEWCVDALIASLHHAGLAPGTIWDPACGSGTIPMRFKEAGCRVIGSDIEPAWSAAKTKKFEDFHKMPAGVDVIVSNPPFSLIEPWVRHGFNIGARRVVFIARLALLEGARRCAEFWAAYPPRYVWVCSRRPSMPPGGTGIKKSGGSVAYAWFDWWRNNTDEPVVRWIK